MSHTKDLELLHVNEPLTSADLKEAFRHLALEHHPDTGGDRDTFEALLAAYRRLLKDVEADEMKCPTCQGRGQTQLGAASFTPVYQFCITCSGSGKR